MWSGATVRRRQLARELREMREQAGMSLAAAAPALDWSPSKLSRIENAQQAVDVHGVRSMLGLYDVGDRWTELIELTREAREKGWWRAHGLDDQGYVPLEAAACSVRDFTVHFVPGLLQTADYAMALLRAGLLRRPDVQPENEVTVRMIRQQRLTSDDQPLELLAVIEESVLHRPVGGPAIQRHQLEHLLETSALPTVTFQILPTALGAHAGMGGAFTMLSFGELDEPDMAYVEHPLLAVHIDKADDVARATLVFDRLRSLALGPADSVALVERVVAEL